MPRCRLWLVLALICLIPARAFGQPSTVAGFQHVQTPDGMEVGIWYPAQGTPQRLKLGLASADVAPGAPLPSGPHALIVLSHGNGGDFASHVDTAVALARAGFVVAALTHPGDNWRDQSQATRVDLRPPALSHLITYMTESWPGRASIDPARIGAWGFSSGGFTVLAAAGGRPDLSRLRRHCADHPTFYDCLLIKAHPGEATATSPWPEMRDGRIKAIVVAAPAIGFAFDRAGLAAVTVPVQLWRADADQILPAPFYADIVRTALPAEPEFHTVAGAGHFDFLAPCDTVAARPEICGSAAGFDRAAFHQAFNAAVAAFFAHALRAPPQG